MLTSSAVVELFGLHRNDLQSHSRFPVVGWSTQCLQGVAESLGPGLTSRSAVESRRDDGLFRAPLGTPVAITDSPSW